MKLFGQRDPQHVTLLVATYDGGEMYVPILFTQTYDTARTLHMTVGVAAIDGPPELRRTP